MTNITASRNQREGRFVGRVEGVYCRAHGYVWRDPHSPWVARTARFSTKLNKRIMRQIRELRSGRFGRVNISVRPNDRSQG